MGPFRTGLVSCLLLALAGAAQAQGDALPLPLDDVRLFTEALDRIRMSYVEEVDDRTLLENAIRGMLSNLDPHSGFVEGREFDVLQETTTGEFGGLGVEVGQRDGYILIIAPIDDTPAQRAGVRAGDLIIAIDNQPVRDMLPEDAASLMRGEPGTDVTITVSRDGLEPFDLEITREVIAVNSVRSRMLEPGYAYVRIPVFQLNTGRDFQDEITGLLGEGDNLKGMVLDLRNNPGGVLQASVEVVDAFIDSGRVVYTRGRMWESATEYFAEAATVAPGLPLVVLINGGSASAAEIVAGALQDHGRAVVMGTRSFGKGSVQSVLPLDGERAIKLTTSLYYTPEGRSIQAQGIEPDIVVEEAFITRRPRNMTRFAEADLPGSLENEAGAGQNAATLISAAEVISTDFQLNEALNLLKGLNTLRPR